MGNYISVENRMVLLQLARRSIIERLAGQELYSLSLEEYAPELQEIMSSFVTLTVKGHLRGCIGCLEAYQPLVRDVQERALQAAFEDPRFLPVRAEEIEGILIEISCLSAPTALEYASPEEIIGLLRPGVDGLILQYGQRRATFLPQVWEELPKPEDFLSHLCLKMGMTADLWQRKVLKAFRYSVESFSEDDFF